MFYTTPAASSLIAVRTLWINAQRRRRSILPPRLESSPATCTPQTSNSMRPLMVKVAALVIIAALWIAFNPFLVSASTAQQATITHSITSFNRDGTATVRFDIPLPSEFLDVESEIEATACFGTPERCVHALLEPRYQPTHS